YLEIFSWHHRNKILYLTLVLPDGSRSFIPATWTNLNEICPQKFTLPTRQLQNNLIATTSSFLHARKIVEALLDKILSSKQKSQKALRKENNHAKTAEPLAHARRAVSNPGDLANFRPQTTKEGNNSACPPDRQNNIPGTSKADQGGKL
ncbi:MAG: hypothetical protein KAI35_07955, partial [Desulfobulbaceae bacterium]|nr:hypothetical protein [Desulfobulbaceae bacterium]